MDILIAILLLVIAALLYFSCKALEEIRDSASIIAGGVKKVTYRNNDPDWDPEFNCTDAGRPRSLIETLNEIRLGVDSIDRQLEVRDKNN